MRPRGAAGLLAVFFAALAELTGCAAHGGAGTAGGEPAAFYDTRLQASLLADDRETLVEDFGMKSSPTLPERTIAAFVLPFTAATETVFLPLWAAMKSAGGVGSPAPGKSLDGG